MTIHGRHTMALLMTSLLLLGSAVNARAADQAAELKTSLQAMHAWVGTGQNGQTWRKYLRSEDLTAQLAQADKADPQVLADVLAQYDSGASGLDLPKFVAVRTSLAAWLETVRAAAVPERGELPSVIREAKGKLQAVTPEQVTQAKAQLSAAVAGLEKYLTPGAANTVAWHKYLKTDELKAQLAEGAKPDLKKLGAIHRLYKADHAGLELPPFLAVGNALLRYGELSNMAAQKELGAWYDKQIDKLAEAVESYEQSPGNDGAEKIGGILGRLASASQAPDLIRAVRHHYAQANLFVEISQPLAAVGVEREVKEKTPIRDNILGTSIRGTGQTTGKVSLRLVPNPQAAELETVLSGKTATKTVGYNGPVTIYSNGITTYTANKKMFFDADGFRGSPAACRAKTNNRVYDVGGGHLATKIAWSRIAQSRGQANRIAAGRAQHRVRKRLDEEASPMISEANGNYQSRYRGPMLRRRTFPERLDFSTTADAIHIVALQANRSQIGAPSEPPKVESSADLAVRVHATLLNNVAEGLLGGETLDDEKMRQTMIDVRGELPESFQNSEDEDPWSITFARRDPVIVAFDDAGFVVTIRGSRYTSGDRSFGAMNVTARYKIAKRDDGALLTRQGEVEILPPGFEQGKDRLGASEIALAKILSKKFGKVFTPEIVAEGLELPGVWKKAGKLLPVELTADDGWLKMAWKLPTPQVVAAEPQQAAAK